MFTNIEILNYSKSPYYNYSKHEITLKIKLEKSVHVQGLFVDLANGPYIEIFNLNSQDSNYQSNDYYEDYGWSNYSRIFKYDILSDFTILDIIAYSSNYGNENIKKYENRILSNDHLFNHDDLLNNRMKRNIHHRFTKHNSNKNNFFNSSSTFIQSLNNSPPPPILNVNNIIPNNNDNNGNNNMKSSKYSNSNDDDNLLVIYSRTYQCDWKSVPFGEFFFKLNEFTTPIGKAFCSFVQDTALIQLKL